MTATRAALALTFALLPQLGKAETDAASCTAIEADLDRLACYDAALRAGPEETSETTPSQSKWLVEIDQSAFDDSTSVVMRVTSTNSARCRNYARPSKTYLIIRCKENSTALFMTGDCHFTDGFDGYGNVDVRVDDNKAMSVAMYASTSNKALGLWHLTDAIHFSHKLLGGRKLLLRATPYNLNPTTFEFDITGIDEAIAPLRKACGW